MSYSYHPSPGGQQPPTGYPYGAYHTATPGTYGQPGTYPTPYQATGAYQTGVTGYGAWPYPYSYAPQQHPQSSAHAQRPTLQTSVTPTSSTPAAPPLPQRSTFTSYTPSYLRESVAAAATGGATGRGSRKQSNFKGLFAKERESVALQVFCFMSSIC